ncbi:MAG: acyl-CoA thioesterase [Candidatus Hydrogenedentota bacterium]
MKHRKHRKPAGKFLESCTEVQVRFQEVDALRIVWHGHYLSYFESARVAFGQQYGLNYTDFVNAQLVVPVVQASCDYIRSASFQDTLRVTARLYKQDVAKLRYYFEVHRASDDALLAVGETVHVFMRMDDSLCLTTPEFMTDWYVRWEPEMREDV